MAYGKFAYQAYREEFIEYPIHEFPILKYPFYQTPFFQRGSFIIITSRNSSGSPHLHYKTCHGRVHNLRDVPFHADEFFEPTRIKNSQEVQYAWQLLPHKVVLQMNSVIDTLEKIGIRMQLNILVGGVPATNVFARQNCAFGYAPELCPGVIMAKLLLSKYHFKQVQMCHDQGWLINSQGISGENYVID